MHLAVEVARADGRVLRAVPRGAFRRRSQVVDPATGDAQVGGASDALTTTRSADAATAAVVAGGATAAGS